MHPAAGTPPLTFGYLSGRRVTPGVGLLSEAGAQIFILMARQLDSIVVIDVESTCWGDEAPAGQESEIIEIGVAVLDVRSHEISGKESILVKPERSQVSHFCAVLTSLTQDILDRGGVSFGEACLKLADSYQTRTRTWASYGDYDRRMFERQCRARGVKYPFGATHLNVKNLFALARLLPREVGMDEALRAAGLELEGRHHRGVDDAYNTAKLLAWMLRRLRQPSRGAAQADDGLPPARDADTVG